MNKFKFLNSCDVIVEHEKFKPKFYKEFKTNFCFSFKSNQISAKNIVHDDEDFPVLRRSLQRSSIDKSEIQESIKKQLKDMVSVIEHCNCKLLYLKMSGTTKNKFRMYYSYEVTHAPRQISEEDLQVGKICGSMMGAKIIQDDVLPENVVSALIRVNNKAKYESIFNCIGESLN